MSKVAKDKNPTINRVKAPATGPKTVKPIINRYHGLSFKTMGLAKPIDVMRKEALEAKKKHRAKKK